MLSAIPITLTAAFFWLVFIAPYRQIHADDKDYFGEYDFTAIEGSFRTQCKLKSAKLFLKLDFTYSLTEFNEKEFPSSGKWRSCWTDDCQFGFNFDKPNYFIASEVNDSSGLYLKLHKPKSDNYFVFKKRRQ